MERSGPLAWHASCPMSEVTEKKLIRLAKQASGGKRKISPLQIAAQVLEEGLAAYPDG